MGFGEGGGLRVEIGVLGVGAGRWVDTGWRMGSRAVLLF